MTGIQLRLFAGEPDILAVAAFARSALRARWPNASYYHPGDFAWQLTGLAGSDDAVLWLDGPQVAGFAIFEPPLNLQFDLLPGMPGWQGLAREMLRWGEERRRAVAKPGEAVPRAYDTLGEGLATTALDSDTARIAVLETEGCRRVDRHNVRMRMALDREIDVPLPAGAFVRSVTQADVAARVALHCDAWSIWGPSQFSETAYRALRASPLYDETLDIVAVTPDGALASSCIGWADAATGTGHFEPVGTSTRFARQGYGKAAVVEGLRRMRERGLRQALMGTASVNDPAIRLYRACGFDVVEREHYWVR